MQNTSNGMSVAALVLSIVGILTMCCGGSVVLGSLAILLALLSRGSHTMCSQAKAAVVISIIGIILGIFIVIGMVVYTFTSPEAQEIYRDYLQYYEDQLDEDDLSQYYRDYLDQYDNGYDLYDNGSDDYLDYISPYENMPYEYTPSEPDSIPGITNL